MKRIKENEKRLDKLNSIITNLEKDLDELEQNIKAYQQLNNYYGSKKWFKDKENFEKGKFSGIKAGVLSEDAVWLLDEKTSDLIIQMSRIINQFNQGKM